MHGLEAFACAEEAAAGAFSVATYYLRVKASESPLQRASSFAIGQTLGTWLPVPGITDEMRREHLARVIGIHEVPPMELTTDIAGEWRDCIVQIAFPDSHFGAQFPMLLSTILGDDVSTSARLKLLDFQLSPTLLSRFPGPKFGIDGVRRLLGVPERPIVLNPIKPCSGYPASVGARLFYDVALGPMDIVKDDELLGNTSFNSIEERVRAYRAAAQRAFDQTGHRTLYAVNITDRPERILENAHMAAENGADMLMINFLAAGLGVLQAVAEDPRVQVPIIGHYTMASALTDSPHCGVASPLLLGKLPRLAGADIVSIKGPYSAYPLVRDRYLRTAQMLRLPLGAVKPSFPGVGGAIHPGVVPRVVADIGNDVVLAVGGAVFSHPSGPAAGARAMLQAIEAAMAGRPLEEHAQDHAELAAALAMVR